MEKQSDIIVKDILFQELGYGNDFEKYIDANIARNELNFSRGKMAKILLENGHLVILEKNLEWDREIATGGREFVPGCYLYMYKSPSEIYSRPLKTLTS